MDELPEDIIIETVLFLSYDDIVSFLKTSKSYRSKICKNRFWYRLTENKWGITKKEFLTNRYYPVKFPKTVRERYAQIASLNGEVNSLSKRFLTLNCLLYQSIKLKNDKYIQEALRLGADPINSSSIRAAVQTVNIDYIEYVTYNYGDMYYGQKHLILNQIIYTKDLDYLKWYINNYVYKEKKKIEIDIIPIYNAQLLLADAYKTGDTAIFNYLDGVIKTLYPEIPEINLHRGISPSTKISVENYKLIETSIKRNTPIPKDFDLRELDQILNYAMNIGNIPVIDAVIKLINIKGGKVQVIYNSPNYNQEIVDYMFTKYPKYINIDRNKLFDFSQNYKQIFGTIELLKTRNKYGQIHGSNYIQSGDIYLITKLMKEGDEYGMYSEADKMFLHQLLNPELKYKTASYL